MRSLDIGLSALRTHQLQLATLGNNIANQATPGYHRQRAELVDRIPVTIGAHVLGTGVDVARISRMRDYATEEALLRNESLVGLVNTELDVAGKIETLLTPGDSSIHSRLSDVFNRLETVANHPEESTVRGEFLSAAQSLINEFNRIDSELGAISRRLEADARIAADDINGLIGDIAELNQMIYHQRATGRQPNDLLDRRDQLVTELSEWMDVSVDVLENGREVVSINGGAIIIGSNSRSLELQYDGDHVLQLIRSEDGTAMPIASGKMRGLLDAVNETIPAVRDSLQTLSREIVSALDQQYAHGLPEKGAYGILHGSRAVDDPNLPLSSAGTAFPVAAGELTITVTDPATGFHRSQRITIDPDTDSLSVIATRLGGLPGVAAFVEVQSNTLVVAGESGSLIDFSGRPDNVPDLGAFSGTSRPEFSGLWTGSDNGQLNVTFSGAGDIGTTPGLTAVVRDQNGDLVAELSVGADYEPGTTLAISEGVSVAFGPGTIVAGDTISTLTTGNPDTSGMLSALGINSLFVGSQPAEFQLRADLKANPSLLAVSRTGRAGEALNVATLAALRDSRRGSLQDRTFVETLADLTAGAGLDVEHARNQQSHLTSFHERLEQDRASISGVDPNEELLRMLEVERAFQAAARFVSTVDETIAELLSIGR